jgi:hypothetical protein
MGFSRLLARTLLFAALAAPAVARAVEIRDVDLAVPADREGRRATFPSHRVFVGDAVSIHGLVFADRTLCCFSLSFTTTAPVRDVRPYSNHLEISGRVAGEYPFGGVTFTTPGRYKLDLHLGGLPKRATMDSWIDSAAGVDATASFDIEVVEFQAVVAPVSVACLTPAVQWESPFANGAICQGKETTLRALPTFHGCEPHTMEFLEPGKLAGTWAVIGTRSAAPWSITHTFTAAGPVRLKVVVKDKNGAKAEAEITANVGPCLDASKFKH